VQELREVRVAEQIGGATCMTTPITPDRPEARVRAAAFGRRFVRR
jgi:hypothetical protein